MPRPLHRPWRALGSRARRAGLAVAGRAGWQGPSVPAARTRSRPTTGSARARADPHAGWPAMPRQTLRPEGGGSTRPPNAANRRSPGRRPDAGPICRAPPSAWEGRRRRRPRAPPIHRSAGGGQKVLAPAHRGATFPRTPSRRTPRGGDNQIRGAAEYPGRSAESSVLLSTKHVDKSVEKPGSSPLSARSVSSPIQIGEKVSEIELNLLNSISYDTL